MSIREAMHVHGEAVEHLEMLYQASGGEVTPESEAAERTLGAAGEALLEAHARYQHWLDAQVAAIDAERVRLTKEAEKIIARREWSAAEIHALMDRHHPHKSRVRAGTRTVSLTTTRAAVLAEGLDPGSLPQAFQRATPGKPAVPPGVAADRKAIAEHMLERVPGSKPARYEPRWHEGEPPEDGWYEIDGPAPERWHLIEASGEWLRDDGWCAEGGGQPLETFGVSFAPEPGKDLLRWRHAPEGVTVEQRVHVRVK